MSHKRNGKLAKAKRQERARDRTTANKQFFDHVDTLSPNERLITAIFGAHETCMECGNEKLIKTDCQTPHCKALRGESSMFYDEDTDDHITIKGSTMYKGVDY